MKTLAISIIITLLASQTMLFGQEKTIQSDKKPTIYDEWPTIESNAKIKEHAKNKSGEIAPNFVVIGRQWNERIITYFFQNGTLDLVGNDEQNAIRAAMAIWSNATDIFFLEVCNQANADISFLFGAGNHGDPTPPCEPGLVAFDGLDGTLAHNMGGPDPGNNCGNQGADVHFDEDENWTDVIQANGNQPIDLFTVAAHELGHALGLFHTTVSGSLMLANYAGSHRFLGADDIAGIRSLYGLPQTNIPISNPSPICTNVTFTLQDQPAGITINWTSSNPNGLAINATTGAATRLNSFNGSVTIAATINSACGSISITRSVWVGTPQITNPTYWLFDSGSNMWQFSQTNGGPGVTYTFYVTSGSADLNQQNQDCYITTSGGATVCVAGINSCGTGTPYCFDIPAASGMLTTTVYPNPVTNLLSLKFNKSASSSTIPFEVILYSEKSMKVIERLSPEKINALESFKANQKIEIDVRSLPRGIYYVHIVPDGKSKLAVQKTRIILE